MPKYKKKPAFAETEDGIKVKQILQTMAADQTFNTKSSYSANVTLHPDHVISFVDKHMQFLSAHPATDPYYYIANLRLMTKKR